jgi:hypothetical protein
MWLGVRNYLIEYTSIVLELGASTSLPTLLASSFDSPPDSILTTDYPDAILIKSVRRNSDSSRMPQADLCDLETFRAICSETPTSPNAQYGLDHAFARVSLTQILDNSPRLQMGRRCRASIVRHSSAHEMLD